MILVIGYGNPLRGDDAVGFLAAERLRGRIADPAVEVLALHQLTPELAEPISRARQVIFIDCCAAGRPGEIVERPVHPQSCRGGAFTHYSSPESLLASARALYGYAPEARLCSVTGSDFLFAAAPSGELERRVEAVVRLVLRRIV